MMNRAKRIRAGTGGESGFTLLEVMIALAIMGIGLGIVMQLFSGSLQAAYKSGKYTDATLLARQKMEEVLLKNELEEGWESGVFSDDFRDFSWEVQIKPYQYADQPVKGQLGADNQVLIKMLQIEVKVSWEEGEKERRVSLLTLRTILKKETLFLS